jgi:hypothetical protein
LQVCKNYSLASDAKQRVEPFVVKLEWLLDHPLIAVVEKNRQQNPSDKSTSSSGRL